MTHPASAFASAMPDGDELAVLHELFAAFPPRAEYLLPLLHQVQARVGCVSHAATRAIAAHFNLSRAEVHGVVTFYHDFRESPVGDTVVQVCMAEACRAVGCQDLDAYLTRRRGAALGEVVPNQRWHAQATYCLGNCALGPSLRIGETVYGRVTPERLERLLADYPDTAAHVERPDP
ncbi:NAD(P)H-dependent oxidoreductase subunit E [Gemmatimonas sp. UBA7669]|jgi:NADH:ubiquinone oxidoreductase subunit E|uniref:NADH-quinone oxidoreductase subunit NuoE family protein n=1 Tax=Gemmatimonas sp. UBA7669 TaxID=1946568 RepID=UPI0025C6D962|nr:NAD(P)H-dependent oxidoreductase subunit E [Gemmatimonas sp. UBA7669]